MKPIVRIMVIVLAVVLAAVWYMHWSRNRALNSGEVFVRNADKPHTETPGSTAPASTQELADNGTASSRPVDVTNLSASDSLTRNSPNGIVNARPGRYQLYRQGDITWRMDTNTGEACVLFATEAQWRKTIVYDHGCGPS
ncbi:MAG TPA: hypothetical protein VGN01_01010 [Acidobacteriaceae bacterium]|jgi:hypothetical protein